MGKEIGIDLGTTNTIVAFINKANRPIALKTNNKEVIIPSVVYFLSKNEYEIGHKALRCGTVRNSALVRNFKSKMGDPKYKFCITAQNGDLIKLTAKQVAAKFLSKLLYNMQQMISREFAGSDDGYIEKAVITVPEKFNSVEREATIAAGRAANLENVSLMMEPTAGAVAYMEENDIQNKTILVYDFGGGTFDISLLENRGGIFKVIRTDGDKTLGGNLLTSRITANIVDKINEEYDLGLPYTADDYDEEYCKLSKEACINNCAEIFNASEKIKCQLSEDPDYNDGEILLIDDSSGVQNEIWFEYEFTNGLIEKVIGGDIQKTIDLTASMIDWANDNNVTIDDIVLIGGSSQIPMIEEKLSRIFPSVIVDVDVSTLIAKGAARVANNSRIEIRECTNAEIGVKSKVGALLDAFKMIIPDNAPLPYSASSDFVITNSDSDSMKIDVYERDVKRKIKNETIRDKSVRKIDEIIINDIPKHSSSERMTATITFTYNSDGSLDLKADLKANDQIIVENHKIIKESNLIAEEG